ncbi:MAG: rhomboid family intramembrane serine protease [Deltaproteobacteria bacterium]|nr:rhomboid family intramembrane serine protease [Deltaproteobacteria bacterium]MBW2480890.1 rhomboid family intramembrane serine protease [Deltaproteobacteria bacterium]
MANSQIQSMLCPNCRKLISVSEARCPFCGMPRPASRWKNNFWTRGFRDANQFVKILIIANVGMYIISLLFNPRATGLSLNPLTFLSPSDTSILLLGATGTVPIDKYHRFWTLVSASFLHGGILHIFFNMAALRQLAALVNREFGVYRMFVIYTVSGVLGFWISYLAGVAFTIGASASVCGLIGALLYYGKSRGGIYGGTLYRQVFSWVIFLFMFGLIVPGINNWGHGGGILAGIVSGFLLGYQEKKRENVVHKTLAAVCGVVTVAVLIWAVGSSIYYRLTI